MPVIRRLQLILPLTLALAGCIERAPTPRDVRAKFDRSGLAGEVLLAELPGSVKRIGANFGGSVELYGFSYEPQQPKPGDKVEVTFYYRVLDDADEDYKIFVHIEDRGRGDRVNGDHWPAGGKYPTSAWRRGEVVKDRWTLKVPSYFEGQGLELWTGFYVPSKDERWPVVNRTQVQNDGQNRVFAGTVPVSR